MQIFYKYFYTQFCGRYFSFGSLKFDCGTRPKTQCDVQAKSDRIVTSVSKESLVSIIFQKENRL